MIERGKFRSLTLVNWNGFFARTFDLDELVTTLSGGNGAGKSTTMAAFVTALIPDLTLLHFRNTTEAGATSGSRDKDPEGKATQRPLRQRHGDGTFYRGAGHSGEFSEQMLLHIA